MDDKDKKALGGAAGGAAAGAVFGPGGAVVGGLLGAAFGSSQGLDEHHQTVLDTYTEIDASATSCSIYVDHIDPDGSAGNPEGEVAAIDGHVPDLVVTQQGGRQLIVEVERATSLDSEAVSQLSSFTVPGYTTLLVVPEEETRAPAQQFVVDNADAIDGQVTVATPDEVPGYL